ncbi:unnamed protein product [Ceratitis capitata]|uniref:(Mediterranean fruit fly) hypothetical protein n=1 Tax=Ceratitis capitata TaxID=7213 RepID=A0A811UID1_CERCA|nr:unnamed protein product [Ceratitis capitata]
MNRIKNSQEIKVNFTCSSLCAYIEAHDEVTVAVSTTLVPITTTTTTATTTTLFHESVAGCRGCRDCYDSVDLTDLTTLARPMPGAVAAAVLWMEMFTPHLANLAHSGAISDGYLLNCDSVTATLIATSRQIQNATGFCCDFNGYVRAPKHCHLLTLPFGC